MKLSKRSKTGVMYLLLIIIAAGCAWLLASKARDKSITAYSTLKNSSSEMASNPSKDSKGSAASGDANKSNQTQNKPEPSNTPAPGSDLISNDKSLPILMYHSIDYEKGNNTRVPKEKFNEQMKYLKDNGYYALTLDEVYDFIENNKPIPKKSVVLTFDDGYSDNYTNAYPILREYGLKATVFMITAYVDNAPFLSTAQLKEMHEYGIDIEPHTVNHDQLDKLTYDQQLQTLRQSKAFLDDLLQKNCKYIAYPFGKYNDATLKAAKEAGYSLAFRMDGGWANKKDGSLTLKRVYIGGDYTLEKFIDKVSNLQKK